MKSRPARVADLPLEDRLASARRRANFNSWLDRQPRDANGDILEGKMVK
jgi:hypothetical protein